MPSHEESNAISPSAASMPIDIEYVNRPLNIFGGVKRLFLLIFWEALRHGMRMRPVTRALVSEIRGLHCLRLLGCCLRSTIAGLSRSTAVKQLKWRNGDPATIHSALHGHPAAYLTP
jgi:hypothetical protein